MGTKNTLIENRFINILQKLETKEISFIFEHCRDLNTRSSTFYEAHAFFKLMLNILHPKQILKIQHIQDIMISLLNCTEIHLRRLKKLTIKIPYLYNPFLSSEENLQTYTYHLFKNT